jgi:hypothetical protein
LARTCFAAALGSVAGHDRAAAGERVNAPIELAGHHVGVGDRYADLVSDDLAKVVKWP